MAERGKARYAYISVGSNTTVKSGAGTIYTVATSNPSGSVVRVEDNTDLGAAPDLNNGGTSTIGIFNGGNFFNLGPGVGFNAGLTIAATSNARVAVVYE